MASPSDANYDDSFGKVSFSAQQDRCADGRNVDQLKGYI